MLPAVLIELDFKGWLTIVGICIGIFLSLGSIIVKPWWDQQVELFTKAVEPKAADKALLAALKQGDRRVFAELSADEQTRIIRSDAMASYLATIKAKDWSVKYRAMLARLLAMLARLFNEPSPAAKPTNGLERRFGAQVFTNNSYHFCLKLALLYPIGFSLISWLVAGELSIGGRVLFESIPAADRWVLLFGMILVGWGLRKALLLWLDNKYTGHGRQWLVVIVGIIGGVYLVESADAGAIAGVVAVAFAVAGAGAIAGAFAVAIAGAVAVAVAVAGAGAGAGAGAVAGAVAFAGAGAGAVAGAFAGAGAVAVAGAVAIFILYLIIKWRPSAGQSFFKFWLKVNALLIGYTVAALLIVIGFAPADRQFLVLLPVFFGLLPLLNAGVDWCSVNITRGLLRVISDNHHKGWHSMGFAVVDLLLAVGFVFVITTIMVIVLGGVNSLLVTVSGQEVLDFSEIMTQLNDPSRYFWQTFWVHAMVLSTLIPTLLHLGYAIIAVVLYPEFGWPQNNAAVFYDSLQAKTKLFYYAMFSRLISGLIFIVVCVGLYYVLLPAIKPIAQGLWYWADLLLSWFDSGYVKVK